MKQYGRNSIFTLAQWDRSSSARHFLSKGGPIFLLIFLGICVTGASEPAKPIELAKPLLAYWNCDEELGGAGLMEATGNSALTVKLDQPVSSRRGVFGNALALRDTHSLSVPGWGLTELEAFSISAWANPEDLGGYREIFRQECGNRLLFSFQENGSVLSLGLNVNGYMECDARLDAAKILDHIWHHCAATFDGHFMRVYLDGAEIGSLERAGKIALCPNVASFIGSSGGSSEYFKGGLDELRLYKEALTAEEIAALYANGMDAISLFIRQMDEAVQSIYTPSASFAETLAATRNNLAARGTPLDPDLEDALFRRLKADYEKECDEFQEYTRANPIDFLNRKNPAFVEENADRLITLLLEYKPLTEHQWSTQTPEDRRKWEEADQFKGRFDELKARGDEAHCAPEWIDLILETGRRVQLRPYKNEPVAPYIPPSTPETRDLTPEDARNALETDWLHQADGNPTPERIKKEIQWTRALLERIETQYPGNADFAESRVALDALEKQADSITASDNDLYFKVHAIKRQAMFKNPVVDFTKMLFVDMPYPQGSEWPHETRHRLGYMAVPGARLLVLDGLEPGGHLLQLMPQAPLHGSFWRPDVSFDGSKVLFCFKPHNEKSFHIYEINADGTGLTQLTDGIYDDLDPVYLPDGHILFPTTRGHTYVRCMPPTNAYVLARADADGRNIYLVSQNNEPDYLPSVMDDGRVVYTRWEYTDKPLWRAQKLWTMNPDGTYVSTLWGNQSVWPDVMKDARNIPGSRRIMFTGSAHHNWFNGSVGIITPEEGFNFPKGLTKITADVEWPECGNGPVDPIESPNYHTSGNYPAYYSPYPLSEHDFLVSAKRGDKFLLYLMDTEGNRELIYEGLNNVFHAIPLKPRPCPPVIMDRVAWPDKEHRDTPQGGLFYSNNVYQGAPEELRGKVKYLRVLHIEPKTYTYWHKRPYISTGPVVSAVQSEGVKRVLGTVPVEEDGSVSFEAPPGKSLHFQLLDENFRALQTMRSFVGLMPGERRGCLGCHESHSRTAMMGVKSLALNQPPRKITPPPWGEDTVSYPRYVQPVLNQYCGKCHQGDGKGRKVLDMTERPTSPVFTEPYMTLIGRPTWGTPYSKPETPPPGFGIANTLMVEAFSTVDPQAYITPKPMTCLSYNSKLIEIASSGKHHDVRVDPISLQRLIAWVDTMCPYRGDDEVREIPDPEFQGVDWLAIRPLIKTAPIITRPGPVD
ncbi:MAG TPA: hypothetical protein PLI09_26755 [Candidatus Hydrogenedentes bacterium]|nr:hypothetical protein [Candidatus Hydrogenedentota bacterium]